MAVDGLESRRHAMDLLSDIDWSALDEDLWEPEHVSWPLCPCDVSLRVECCLPGLLMFIACGFVSGFCQGHPRPLNMHEYTV